MELTFRRIAALATLVVLTTLSACADNGFEFQEDTRELPASVDDLLDVAEAIAVEWSDDAYLWGIGGGYSVGSVDGLSRNHSFRFYSLQAERTLSLHFFAGAHWAISIPRPRTDAPAPLRTVVDFESRLMATEAISIAVSAVADSVLPSLDVPDAVAPRLLSNPVWPQRNSTMDEADSLAWRVDFVETRSAGGGEPRWWSIIRVYVHPQTGEVFEVVDDQPQVYPNL